MSAVNPGGLFIPGEHFIPGERTDLKKHIAEPLKTSWE